MPVPDPVNAALFFDADDAAFLAAALQHSLPLTTAFLITDDPDLLPDIPQTRRYPFDETALDRTPIDPAEVLARLRPRLKSMATGGLVVDMGWAVANTHGANSLESWGHVAERLRGNLATRWCRSTPMI